MAVRNSNPAIRHFDKDTGAPLAGGQMFFFEPGSSTPKDTFSDQAGTIPNANPVILDGNGVEPNIFGTGSYRIVLRAAPIPPATVGVQQWERDPVIFEDDTGDFGNWNSTTSYAVNDIVQASDANFYIAIAANSNINPTLAGSETSWSQVDIISRWNTNQVYGTGDLVRDSLGILNTATVASGPGTGQGSVDPATLIVGATPWRQFENLRLENNNIRATNSNGGINLITNGTGEVQGGGIDLARTTKTVQVFTANGTWTKPAGVKFIEVVMVGGGAGGGATNTSAVAQSQPCGGGGGGAGAYIREFIDVTAETSATVTVGVGGGGGDAGATGIGINGSATTQSLSIAIAGGGFGGQPSTSIIPTGGSGGAATGLSAGGVGTFGGDGDGGAPFNTITKSGHGGASFFGGGGRGSVQSEPARNGRAYGSGGAGGATQGTDSRVGGDGADGVCIITEYY